MYQGICKANVLLDGTIGAQFEDQLQPLPHEPVVVKKRVSAHFGTELPTLLRAMNASAVVRVWKSTPSQQWPRPFSANYELFRTRNRAFAMLLSSRAKLVGDFVMNLENFGYAGTCWGVNEWGDTVNGSLACGRRLSHLRLKGLLWGSRSGGELKQRDA